MACVEEGMIQASGVQEEKMASGFCGGGLFRLPPFPLLPPPPSKAWRHPLISTALKNISYYLRLLSCPEHTRERRVCSVQHQEEGRYHAQQRETGEVRGEDRASLALPFGSESPCQHFVVQSASKGRGAGGDTRMEQLKLKEDSVALLCTQFTALGSFIIFWGQQSVPFLGSQIEFPDLVLMQVQPLAGVLTAISH